MLYMLCASLQRSATLDTFKMSRANNFTRNINSNYNVYLDHSNTTRACKVNSSVPVRVMVGRACAWILCQVGVLIYSVIAVPVDTIDVRASHGQNEIVRPSDKPQLDTPSHKDSFQNVSQSSNLSWTNSPWVKRRGDFEIQIDQYAPPRATALQAQLAVTTFSFLMARDADLMADIDDGFPIQDLRRLKHGVLFEITPGAADAIEVSRPFTGREVLVISALLGEWVDTFAFQETIPSALFALTKISDGIVVAHGAVYFGVAQNAPARGILNGSETHESEFKRPEGIQKRSRNITQNLGPVGSASSTGTHMSSNDTFTVLQLSPYILRNNRFRVELWEDAPSITTGFEMTNFLIDMLVTVQEEIRLFGNGDPDNMYHEAWYQLTSNYITLTLKDVGYSQLTYAHIDVVNDALRGWCPPGIRTEVPGQKIKVYDIHTKTLIVEGNLIPLALSQSKLIKVTNREAATAVPFNNTLTLPAAPFIITMGPVVVTIANYRQPNVRATYLDDFIKAITDEIVNQSILTLMGMNSTIRAGHFWFPFYAIDFTVDEVNGGGLTYRMLLYSVTALAAWGHSGPLNQKIPSASISIALLSRPEVPIATGTMDCGMRLFANNTPSAAPSMKRDLERTGEVADAPFEKRTGNLVVTISDYMEPYKYTDNFDNFINDLEEDLEDDRLYPITDQSTRLPDGILIYSSSLVNIELREVNGGSLTQILMVQLLASFRYWIPSSFYERDRVLQNIPSATIRIARRYEPDTPIVQGTLRCDSLESSRNSSGKLMFKHTDATNNFTGVPVSKDIDDNRPSARMSPEPFISKISPYVITISDYASPYAAYPRFAELAGWLHDDFSRSGRPRGERDEDRLLSGAIAYEYENVLFEMKEENAGKLTWGIGLDVVAALRQWGLTIRGRGVMVPSVRFSVDDEERIGYPIVKGSISFGGVGAGNGSAFASVDQRNGMSKVTSNGRKIGVGSLSNGSSIIAFSR